MVKVIINVNLFQISIFYYVFRLYSNETSIGGVDCRPETKLLTPGIYWLQARAMNGQHRAIGWSNNFQALICNLEPKL